LDTCLCGTAWKQFWLWRDSTGALHASSFPPSNGIERTVLAATVRDALLPLTDGGTPKHAVRDASDPNILWEGRCRKVAV